MASSTSSPVRRGRRVALTPAEHRPDHGGRVYLVAGRDLRYEGRLVPAGVEIPGAADWHRVEAWVTARRIRLAAPGEDFVSYETWVAPFLEAEAAELAELQAQAQVLLEAEAAAAAEAAGLDTPSDTETVNPDSETASSQVTEGGGDDTSGDTGDDTEKD